MFATVKSHLKKDKAVNYLLLEVFMELLPLCMDLVCFQSDDVFYSVTCNLLWCKLACLHRKHWSKCYTCSNEKNSIKFIHFQKSLNYLHLSFEQIFDLTKIRHIWSTAFIFIKLHNNWFMKKIVCELTLQNSKGHGIIWDIINCITQHNMNGMNFFVNLQTQLFQTVTWLAQCLSYVTHNQSSYAMVVELSSRYPLGLFASLLLLGTKSIVAWSACLNQISNKHKFIHTHTSNIPSNLAARHRTEK